MRAIICSKRTIDQFDRLYAESEKRAKFCALAIHPYISGQPHRIKYLEAIYKYVNKHKGVLHWNGAQILDWYQPIANQTNEGRVMNFPKPAVGMLPNDRLDYSADRQTQAAEAAEGARMAVWTVTNVEEWDPTQTMPRTVLTPAGRRLADAGHSQLVLARIRQPGRLLAAVAGL